MESAKPEGGQSRRWEGSVKQVRFKPGMKEWWSYWWWDESNGLTEEDDVTGV